MRIAAGFLATLALTSAGLLACSTQTSTGSLTFTVAESLFVFEPDNPASGYVLLSNATGNCVALQSGTEPANIGNTSYLLVLLEQIDALDEYAPITAGTYTILDPTSSSVPTPPALFAYSAIVQTDSLCNATGANASSGTATLAPLDTTDGGISQLSYLGVYGGVQLSGTSQLTTCLVASSLPYDAGTCLACTGPGDGGACTIQ